jgi:hypothetical protein
MKEILFLIFEILLRIQSVICNVLLECEDSLWEFQN